MYYTDICAMYHNTHGSKYSKYKNLLWNAHTLAINMLEHIPDEYIMDIMQSQDMFSENVLVFFDTPCVIFYNNTTKKAKEFYMDNSEKIVEYCNHLNKELEKANFCIDSVTLFLNHYGNSSLFSMDTKLDFNFLSTIFKSIFGNSCIISPAYDFEVDFSGIY